MNEIIKLERKENGQIVFKGEISRKSQAELMDFIKSFYKDDNEVSTKLSKYLPKTVKIQLDVTRNDLKDIPIRRTHTIMWAIINKWFEC